MPRKLVLKKGLFIVFEGLDGSGSTTQANLLADKLRKIGHKAFVTKEPTNNIIGGLIRGQLTGDWKASMECMQLLFAADRAHHLDREIKSAIHKNKIIISDRYLFSSIAYGSLDIDRNWLLEINRKFLLPDYTFLIKLSPKNCIKRMKKSRFELELFEKEKKLQKVWKTYEWLAKKFKNVFIIDGTKNKELINKEIFEIIENILN